MRLRSRLTDEEVFRTSMSNATLAKEVDERGPLTKLKEYADKRKNR
jgi:hypothetical protein